MGRDKLLLPWGKRTILEHCRQVLLRSKIKEVIVVLNPQNTVLTNGLGEKRIKVVLNPDYKKGMSGSIRRGIRALNPKSDGILIALGDMPSLKSRTIDAILRAFREEKGNIILPSFRGRQGHPVLFHRKYKGELLKLKGDTGGKSIIMKHPEDVFVVPIKSEGVIRDIDTWVEYKKELRVKG